MANRVAAKTVDKAVKAAAKPKAAVAKPKPAAPKPVGEKTTKTVAIPEKAGFKDSTARKIFNEMNGKLSLSTLNDVQNHVFTSLRTTLVQTGRVNIPGVGTFKVSARAARNGRNPKTGDTMAIPAKNGIRFSATPAWKTEVQAFKVPAKVAKTPKAAK